MRHRGPRRRPAAWLRLAVSELTPSCRCVAAVFRGRCRRCRRAPWAAEHAHVPGVKLDTLRAWRRLPPTWLKVSVKLPGTGSTAGSCWPRGRPEQRPSSWAVNQKARSADHGGVGRGIRRGEPERYSRRQRHSTNRGRRSTMDSDPIADAGLEGERDRGRHEHSGHSRQVGGLEQQLIRPTRRRRRIHDHTCVASSTGRHTDAGEVDREWNRGGEWNQFDSVVRERTGARCDRAQRVVDVQPGGGGEYRCTRRTSRAWHTLRPHRTRHNLRSRITLRPHRTRHTLRSRITLRPHRTRHTLRSRITLRPHRTRHTLRPGITLRSHRTRHTLRSGITLRPHGTRITLRPRITGFTLRSHQTRITLRSHGTRITLRPRITGFTLRSHQTRITLRRPRDLRDLRDLRGLVSLPRPMS